MLSIIEYIEERLSPEAYSKYREKAITNRGIARDLADDFGGNRKNYLLGLQKGLRKKIRMNPMG